jgi:hypothetical protein
MRKLHILRVDKAIEEIGFDVAELGNVSEEYINAVRDELDKRDQQAKKAAEAKVAEAKVADEAQPVSYAINN